MMRDGLLFVFHVISCAQFSFAVYYDYMYVVVPRRATEMFSGYGGKFKFLTFWDAVSIVTQKSFPCHLIVNANRCFWKNFHNRVVIDDFFRH